MKPRGTRCCWEAKSKARHEAHEREAAEAAACQGVSTKQLTKGLLARLLAQEELRVDYEESRAIVNQKGSL